MKIEIESLVNGRESWVLVLIPTLTVGRYYYGKREIAIAWLAWSFEFTWNPTKEKQ